MSALDNGRFTAAAGACGLIQACIEASVNYCHERETFGKPIGMHQLVQQMIAKMEAGYQMSRLLVYRAGELKNKEFATHAKRHLPNGRLVILRTKQQMTPFKSMVPMVIQANILLKDTYEIPKHRSSMKVREKSIH